MPASTSSSPSLPRRGRVKIASGARRPTSSMPGCCASCSMQDRLPESWIAPAHILDLRVKVRLRKTLVSQRTEWLQRIHAVLFHHGVPVQAGRLGRLEGRYAREQLAALELPAAAVQQITVALGFIDYLNGVLHDIDLELDRFARRQPGCRALMAHYGIGTLVATAIVAELGDTRRMSSSRQAVRCAGLDITVHQSDAATTRRAPLAPRLPGPALGRLRGRTMRRQARVARPRLLRAAQGAPRSQPRRADDRAQAAAPRAPHAARARRRRDGTCPLTLPGACAAAPSVIDRGQLPQNCRPHRAPMSDPERLSGHTAHRGITPINDLVAAPCPGREHRDKAGHPRATGTDHELQEVR